MIVAFAVGPGVHLLFVYAIFLASYLVFAIGRFPGTKIDADRCRPAPCGFFRVGCEIGCEVCIAFAFVAGRDLHQRNFVRVSGE